MKFTKIDQPTSKTLWALTRARDGRPGIDPPSDTDSAPAAISTGTEAAVPSRPSRSVFPKERMGFRLLRPDTPLH